MRAEERHGRSPDRTPSGPLCDPTHTAPPLHNLAPANRHPQPIPVLLDTHITLPAGGRVRLRMPHVRDQLDVLVLLERLGVAAHELDVRRALRFDPRHRAVLCATVWTGSGESVAGVGAISYGAAGADLLLADELLAPGLGAALEAILVGAAAQRQAA